MKERLFVYGTLGPGRPNDHVLEDIGGSWENATVNGVLRREGWGAEFGYPGIDLDEHGAAVDGFLFTSEHLSEHWTMLDSFEGSAYERVLTKARIAGGKTVDAYIYTLRPVR